MTTTTIYESLKTTIEAAVSPMRVYPRGPESVNELPAATLIPQTFDPVQTFGGTLASYTTELVIYVASADEELAWEKAQDFLDNSGSNSISAAVATDPTLTASVEGIFVRAGNAAVREVFSGVNYVTVSFIIEYWRN